MAGHNVSALREAIVCLTLFGVVLQFTSIVGTEWAVPPSAGTGGGSDTFLGVGLWRKCYNKEDASDKFHIVCNNLVGSGVPGWISGVQAMSILAILFNASALLSVITFTCCGSRRHDKRLLIVFIVAQSLAGIFNLVGVVLFSQKVQSTFQDELGLLQLAWCFIINCVANALIALTVILAAVEFVFSKSTIPMERFSNEMDPQAGGATAAAARRSGAPSGSGASPTGDNNGMHQGYQNSDIQPADHNSQSIPTAHIPTDISDSNA